MKTVADVLVPLVSVLIGAGLTYYLNVRQRKQNRVDDLFDEAVEAVSVVISSMSYVPGYGKWHKDVTEEERIALEKEVAREATITHMRAIAEARNAVAKCSAYAPSLRPYLDEPVLYFQQRPKEIIVALREAQRALRRSRSRAALVTTD